MKADKKFRRVFMAMTESIRELTESIEDLKEGQETLVRKNKTTEYLMKEMLQWKTEFEAFVTSDEVEGEMESQLKMFGDAMTSILKNAGAVPFRTDSGKMFDSEFHQVAGYVKTDDASLSGKIVSSVTEGYRFNGEVVVEEAVEIYVFE